MADPVAVRAVEAAGAGPTVGTPDAVPVEGPAAGVAAMAVPGAARVSETVVEAMAAATSEVDAVVRTGATSAAGRRVAATSSLRSGVKRSTNR